jgi:hypothetical protein
MFTILAQSLMTAARQDDTTIPRWNAPRHWRTPPHDRKTERRERHD